MINESSIHLEGGRFIFYDVLSHIHCRHVIYHLFSLRNRQAKSTNRWVAHFRKDTFALLTFRRSGGRLSCHAIIPSQNKALVFCCRQPCGHRTARCTLFRDTYGTLIANRPVFISVKAGRFFSVFWSARKLRLWQGLKHLMQKSWSRHVRRIIYVECRERG